jgi:hypothetical protein
VRECRAIPVYSSLLVRFYHYKARTRLRVQRAPGIPHALYFLGERFINDSGALRVARANVFVEFIVIASAATHTPSFRGDAKHRTRNLEIPGLVLRTIPE